MEIVKDEGDEYECHARDADDQRVHDCCFVGCGLYVFAAFSMQKHIKICG